MDQNLIIMIVVAVVLLAVLILFLRGRSGPAETRPHQQENGLAEAAVAAVEDVTGPLVGVDLHPDLPPGEDDDLTRIKGLGPRASARLQELGIRRYAHLAKLTPDQANHIDAQMGELRGRLFRDKWVEQASHLAEGDRDGFEAKFGRLG
jgi:predicted flap endonuclease-1-like 5' DNA nuclease